MDQSQHTGDNQNVNAEDAIKNLYALAMSLLVKHKKASWEVVKMLTEQGVDSQVAVNVVGAAVDKINAEIRKTANKNMLYGGLWCVGGLIITAFTYAAASGGGRYIVTYGAIVVGAIQFIRGAAGHSKTIG